MEWNSRIPSFRGKESSMSALTPPVRGIWPVGYPGIVAAAGAEPVLLKSPTGKRGWADVLRDIHGVVYAGQPAGTRTYADEQSLCLHCRDRRLPVLAIDQGLHTLNATFGGSVYLELARELPEAL